MQTPTQQVREDRLCQLDLPDLGWWQSSFWVQRMVTFQLHCRDNYDPYSLYGGKNKTIKKNEVTFATREDFHVVSGSLLRTADLPACSSRATSCALTLLASLR